MGAGLGIACLAHLPTTISDPPLFPPSGRHLRYEKALISTKGRLQAFMCCTWVHDTAVAGTADGHLYTFEPVDGRLSRDLTITKKAHDDMITSMCTYVGGLCTGGKVSCQLKPHKRKPDGSRRGRGREAVVSPKSLLSRAVLLSMPSPLF